MAHKRTHHKLTKSRPIPCSRTVLTGHRHAQSDCGHGSTQSRRSRSLLRNFSLRSLRKSRHQDDVQPPWPPLALAPSSPSSTGENITDTGSAPSQSSSCSSGVNASLRVRSALYHQDAMSSPLTGGPGPGSPGGIRSLFLPFETVSRLVGPLWSLPSSEDSSCDTSIGQVDEWTIVGKIEDQSEPQLHITESALDLALLPPPTSLSTPSTPSPSPLPSNSSTPPLPFPNVNSGQPPSSSTSILKPTPTPSNPNLELSVSQKRRTKFILGDELDLDCDSLAVSVSPPIPRHETLVDETRDQFGTTSTSSSSSGIKSSITNEKNTRRWGLTSALTDEDISDEGLTKELERMREILEWDCTPIDVNEHHTSPFFPSPSPSPPSNRSNSWPKTQRALLTTRELILTERHYLSSLLLLLRPDSTLTPVPEMMIQYAKELVDVSEKLLKAMEGEPSVRGVAEAFVEVGEGMGGAESAFVGWCGVVGGWFQDGLPISRSTQAMIVAKRRRGLSGDEENHPMISEHEGSNPGLAVTFTPTEHAHTSPLMRTVRTWRRSMPSIAGSGEGHRGRTSPTSFAVGYASSISLTSSSNSKPIRKPAVRDLAILPTQRIMRYVLLYRDLLANTRHSSSSYPLVERAVEVACRIAEKCDQAQGNAAFIAGGSVQHSSSSGNSMLNNNNHDGLLCKQATIPESNLNLKRIWGYTISSNPPNSMTGSPKSHSLSSSLESTSPSQSPSKLSLTPRPVSLSFSTSPPKNRPTSPSLPPPSAFHSKTPIPRSGSISTSSSSTSTTITTSSSSSSSSSSSLFPP